LRPYNGVFIPPDDFFAADFIEDEWVELLPDGSQFKKSIISTEEENDRLSPLRMSPTSPINMDLPKEI